MAAAGYKNATAPLVLRTRERVLPFFGGFDLVEPGLVQAPPGPDQFLGRVRVAESKHADKSDTWKIDLRR